MVRQSDSGMSCDTVTGNDFGPAKPARTIIALSSTQILPLTHVLATEHDLILEHAGRFMW